MNRTKRAIFAVVLVIAVLFAVSCGKKKDSGETKVTSTPTAVPTALQAQDPELTVSPEAQSSPTGTPEPDPTLPPLASPTPTPLTLSFDAPAENCEIAFPTGEKYHYDMELKLDPAAHTVSGHVVFDFYNDTQDAWEQLCMRDYPSLFTDPRAIGYDQTGSEVQGAMTVITVLTDSRDGAEIEFTREKDISVLWLPLSKPLQPGESMTLSYDFTATIPLLADRFGLADGIFCVTNFYPILSEYANGEWSREPYFDYGECFVSEIANYDVRLTVPAGYLVASTGTETAKSENGDAVTYTFKAPFVRDFVFAASNEVEWATKTFDGVRVNVLYSRQFDDVKVMEVAAEKAFEAAEYSLIAFAEAFGKYPYEELDIIFSPMGAGGMEYPNLVLIAEDEAWPVGGAEDEFLYLKTIVAHEIAHQWFMGIVGSDSGLIPWQDEALASYAEIVYMEYLVDHDMLKTMLGSGRFFVDLTKESTAEVLKREGLWPINRPADDYEDMFVYTESIYTYGHELFVQLEPLVGYKNVHAFLRKYVQKYAFTNADTKGFLEMFFECFGRDNELINRMINGSFGL